MTEKTRPLLETHDLVDTIAIICTWRGQHKRARLTTVKFWRDRQTGSEEAHMGDEGRHWAAPTTDGGRTLPYEFWCGRCPGNYQQAPDRWWEIVHGARSAGLAELDVSLLM